MVLILDVDNTLYKTSKYLKSHQLLSAPMRDIPYWSFYKKCDRQLERDIFLFKSIPLRLLEKNTRLLHFIKQYKDLFHKIVILTGRILTAEEKEIILNDINVDINISFEDDKNFIDKMNYLDSMKDFIVADDYTGIESFVRDIHLTHNAYYIVPDLNAYSSYTKQILKELFKYDHMKYNKYLYD